MTDISIRAIAGSDSALKASEVRPRVCLLSPADVWVNPRLVKEADALATAGYDVVVGYRSNSSWARDRDDPILARKPWQWHRFEFGRVAAPFRWFRSAVRQKFAERLVRLGIRDARLDAEAYCRGYSTMLSWAIAQRADLYIAHTQPALAIAAQTAKITGARFAFDCEDLLSEEAADGGRASWLRDVILRIESRYLPLAAYVSATSVPMRGYLRARYSLERVPVWTNSFPLHEVRGLLAPDDRPRNARVKLAWMSATLGPGRGIEDILAALPQLSSDVELHLFGNIHAQYRDWLDTRLSAAIAQGKVHLHPLPPPEAVMPTLAACDVGLALDQNDCLNRSLTICNKVCLYLQAGLANVATATPGQASVLRGRYEAGILYEPGEVDELVRVIESLCDRERLAALKNEAWRAGQETYNWDVESAVFLDSVRLALHERVPG